jgi:hypothetical protein
MGHEWKVGDWCDYNGKRGLVYLVQNDVVNFVSRTGHNDYSYLDSDAVKHLPDCTGWDWEPPKPELQYRPFANAAEFAPYRDQWVKDKKTGSLIARPVGYDASCVHFINSVGNEYIGSYEKLFSCVLFEDGSPFGVMIES